MPQKSCGSEKMPSKKAVRQDCGKAENAGDILAPAFLAYPICPTAAGLFYPALALEFCLAVFAAVDLFFLVS